jgi:DNA-binding MurR/RpiR family transcriptional regulator
MPVEKPDPDTIEDALRAAFDSLGKGQQKVAEFVLTRGVEASYLPASRIAELAEVSHSTVVRLAQGLGLEGFPDLQAILQERYLRDLNSTQRLELGSSRLVSVEREGEEQALVENLFQADIDQLETMRRGFSTPDFLRAVELLDSARQVYVIGLRASAPQALTLIGGLRHIRPGCTVLQPGHGDLVDQLVDIAPGDLLVSMSYARYAKETLRCVEYAVSRGASTLALTDSKLSPAARIADIVLVMPTHLAYFVVSVASISLIGALLSALALRRRDGSQARLERLEGLFEAFQLYAGPDA